MAFRLPLRQRSPDDKKKRNLLLNEFYQYMGNPNRSGVSRQPVITSYRQDFLRWAQPLYHLYRDFVALRSATFCNPAATTVKTSRRADGGPFTSSGFDLRRPIRSPIVRDAPRYSLPRTLTKPAREVETQIAAKPLNHMLDLGRPDSVRVV